MRLYLLKLKLEKYIYHHKRGKKVVGVKKREKSDINNGQWENNTEHACMDNKSKNSKKGMKISFPPLLIHIQAWKLER